MAGVQVTEELENILQCPVCYEIPESTSIYQCDRGHHLCEPCYQQMRESRCPICKALFYGTRNFVAEELIKIFPILKIERALTAEPASAAVPSTQTNEAEVQVKTPPLLCQGLFPCLIGECKRSLGAGRMLQHIRHCHRAFLVEVSARNKYTEDWKFPYSMHCTYVEAIRIANMGLFFLILDMDENGLLQAAVQMVASKEVAAMFKFKIKILDVNKEARVTFKDKIFSCRDTLAYLAESGHCLEFDTNKFSYLQRNGSVMCSISIIDGRQ